MATRTHRLLLALVLLVSMLGIAMPAYAAEPSFDGDAEALANAEWMCGISGDRLLSDIVLPGSAGAATSSVFNASTATSGLANPNLVTAQDRTIATQLTDGVRLFELHLSAQDPGSGWSGSKDTLWVAEQEEVNGNKVLYYAQDASDNAISFKRAINYMRSFLKKHPYETVVVALSETDDASQVFRKLRTELDDYRNYLYLGSEMPKLKDVRGKVVVCTTHPELLGEDGGMAFPARGTTSSVSVGGVQFSPLAATNAAEAQGLAFADSVPLAGDAHAIHSSVVYAGMASSAQGEPTPRAQANEVNPVLFDEAGKFATRGTLYGWVLADFMNQDQARRLWMANFPDGLEYYTVEFWTRQPTERVVHQTHVLKRASAYSPAIENVPGKYLDGWLTDDGTHLYKLDEGIPITQDNTKLWASWTMSWASLADWLSQQGGKTASVSLERDLTATPLDRALIVPAGADVTIDLAGYTLDRGLTTAGRSEEGGSVVQLESGAKLTLTGAGMLTGGYTTGLGGGVLMSEDSTLVLDGVTITGNVAQGGGAGVYVPNGSTPQKNANLVVKGATEVTGNRKNFSGWPRQQSNVVLGEDVTLTIDDTLANEARIGVTTFKKPTSGNYVTFTQGLSGKGSASNFTSDDEACLVGQVEGEGVLTTGVVVRFNTMGGNSMADQLVAEGTHVPVPKNPWKYDKRRVGVDELNGECAFRGWYKDETCSQPWDFDQDIVTTDMLQSGLTLYAKWGVRYTFNSDDGSEPVSNDSNHPMQYDAALGYYYIDLDYGEQLSFDDSSVTMPSSTKTGWELGGWTYYTEPADQVGMLFDFNTPATMSLAFTGRWRKPRGPQYTVWFSPHNRTSELPFITVYSGDKINQNQVPTVVEPGNEGQGTITRLEGCELEGWYKDSNCTRAWDFATNTVTADTVLHAKWRAKTYKVKFMSTDGENELAPEQNVPYGECATKPNDPTAVEGYRFAGWQDPRDRPGYPYLFTRPITQDLTLKAIWKVLSYTVSFDAEGGTLAPYTNSQKIEHGHQATKPGDPTREGYTFQGWYVTNPSATYNFSTPVTADFVLHAAWQKQCTITFDAAGGTMAGEQSRTVAYGAPIGTLPTPAKGTDLFCGWFHNGMLVDASTTVTSNMTLVAQWRANEPQTFTVVFDSKGGSAVPSQTVAVDGLVTKPTDPTYGERTFQGWRAKGQESLFDFTQAVPDGLIVNGVLTLEAVWLPAQRTVSFDAGDAGSNATGMPIAQTMAYGSTVLEPTDPVWQGYVFKHWVKDGESTPYDFTTPVTEDFTLCAVWAKLCTVTFDSAGGSDVQSQVVVEGDVAIRPENPIHNDHHTFGGWFENDATEPFTFTTPITDDLTLHAHWTVSTYTVTFNTGEGGSAVAGQTVECGACATEPENPTREGRDFLYWHQQGSDVAYDFNTPVTGDLTLVAAWNEHPTYNVFFDSAGGSAVESQSVAWGGLVERPFDPTKEGMRFAGWYVGDTQTAYDFATPVVGDLTLVAHWTDVAELPMHTVTFQVNKEGWTEEGTWKDGTTADKTQPVQEGSCVSEPSPNPTRDNYTLDGWYELISKREALRLLANPKIKDVLWIDGDETLVSYNFRNPVTSNITLRARWRGVPHTVTFDTCGGSELSPVTCRHGERLGSVSAPIKDGCYFVGWSRVAGDFTSIEDTHFLLVNEDMTLHANWSEFIPMHVDVDPNNGEATTRQDVAFFSQAQRPTSDPVREGHEFDGWFEVLSQGYVSPESAKRFWGSDPDYESKIHIDTIDGTERVLRRYNFAMPVTHNIQLRAQWIANALTVTFVSGNEVVDEQEVAWGSQATPTQDPYRNGYVFVGWYADEALTKAYDFTEPVTQNLTLYAKFKEAGEGDVPGTPGADPTPTDPVQETYGIRTSIAIGLGAPVVSQREGSFDAVMRAMFAQEVAKQDVFVTLASNAVQEQDLADDERSLATAKLGELGAQVGVWFDLSIAKRAGSEQANPVAVHTTDEPLKLTVAVPQALRAGDGVTRTFYVLRVHGGTVDVLAKGTGNALDIESDCYSPYLLAYADAAQSGQAEKSGQTGQTGKPGQTAATGTTSGGSSVVSTTSTQATARTGDTTPGIALLATLAAALLGLGCALRASRVR
ncbi:MAG: InlB B-repeat-containing protein [Coriobacteriales bacterium]|nr:InlB B-repeat-containing protein [Coriobacteriales bacterium]